MLFHQPGCLTQSDKAESDHASQTPKEYQLQDFDGTAIHLSSVKKNHIRKVE